jgi:tripartite-type tricarboxylate transporter receptor subunit TctC
MSAALSDPSVVERVKKYRATPSYGDASEYATLLKSEVAKWERVVQKANIKVQ